MTRPVVFVTDDFVFAECLMEIEDITRGAAVTVLVISLIIGFP